MDEKKKPSIVDVAKWAGVSTATVSRVINHNGGYSRETEEKVKKAVNECEFTPNANAIGLRTNKSRCIGVIVPDVTNEFFARIIQELDFYLLKHKYSLLICNSNEDYELENMHIRGLIEKHIDGIVYISGQNEIKHTGKIRNIPVVYIDRAPKNAEMLIMSDNQEGGYLRALREGNIPYNEELEVSCFPEYAQARSVMDRLMKSRGCFFDGIFATNDMMALACINVLLEAGVKIPEEVKVVGFDNISLTRFTSPQITTITQDTRQMALAAGSTILKMIQKKEIREKTTIIPVTLEVRGTT